MLRFLEWLIFISLALVLPIESAAPQSVNVRNSGELKPAPAGKDELSIVFVGDSLTQGYGVNEDEAYPAVTGKLLEARGYRVRIVNGGISASVSADADRRLKWYLRAKPYIVVLALGGNDGLKGTPPEVIKRNLGSAIDFAAANGIKVLLCGIKVFTNFGPEYATSFAAVFSSLAKEKKVPFLPFLLEGVALHPDLMQADGKHPNSTGHQVVARAVELELEKMLPSSQKEMPH